jgi:hypothetical protein
MTNIEYMWKHRGNPDCTDDWKQYSSQIWGRRKVDLAYCSLWIAEKDFYSERGFELDKPYTMLIRLQGESSYMRQDIVFCGDVRALSV